MSYESDQAMYAADSPPEELARWAALGEEIQAFHSGSGIEVGAEVIVRPLESDPNDVDNDFTARRRALSQLGTFKVRTIRDVVMTIVNDVSGAEHTVDWLWVERTHRDIERVRLTRMAILAKAFPGLTYEQIEGELPRFVLVMTKEKGMPSHMQPIWNGGSTFAEAADMQGVMILEGYQPEGVYDLDCGEKIDVSVSSPAIGISEDRHATVNELDPVAMRDHRRYVANNFEIQGTEVLVKLTIANDPEQIDVETLKAMLAGSTGAAAVDITSVDPIIGRVYDATIGGSIVDFKTDADR